MQCDILCDSSDKAKRRDLCGLYHSSTCRQHQSTSHSGHFDDGDAQSSMSIVKNDDTRLSSVELPTVEAVARVHRMSGEDSDNGTYRYLRLLRLGGAVGALALVIVCCYCCYMRCCAAKPPEFDHGVPPPASGSTSYLPLGELNPVDSFAQYRDSPGTSPNMEMELRGHSAL